MKTFNLNPGEKFGVVLVPNGEIEELLNYPNLPGNKRPLFSLATDNPDDDFWSGQIAKFKEESGLLAIEDLSVNGTGSDRDYNDLVLNLSGATATVPSLDEVINPALSWPDNNLGNKLNQYINFSDLTFDSGVFKASDSGELKISYLFDGGGYQGDLALVNLEGLNAKSHPDFVKQAAERALSNSELGYVVIKDKEEGALFDKRLGEKSRNAGEYLGEKTFSVNPGDEYGFMLVPNGTVEEVFERPNIGWSKRPVFSMSTEAEIDTFLPGQFVDLTGEGQVFVFEDVRADRPNFDGDYNDFVFSVSGLEGSADSVEEYINPLKDWRSDDNGQEFLEIVDELINGSSQAPTITVELANDTGEDDTDKITTDPSLTGEVIDDGEVVSFSLSLTGESESFVDVTAELESDGSFVLDRSVIESVLPETLPLGINTVYLRATDEEGLESEVVEFEFTLEEEESEDGLGPEIESMAGISGLDAYPDAISLPPTGTRELSVKIDGWLDSPELTADIGDISYVVEDGNVLEVSPEGVITALAGGETNVTVEYGEAEITIPVLVEAPETGPAVVDESGGIVQGSDGSMVMLAPGALTEESLVNLTPLQQEDLSLPVPSGFKFATAFDLEIEDDKLDLPAQLAVPAPAEVEAGTEVWFMRKGALPDETGTWKDIWLQEESGIVDADGFIRTQSPPYPGILRPGEYMVVFDGQPGSMTIAKGKVTQTTNVPLAFFGIIDPDENIGQLIDPEYFVTAFSVSYDISSVDVIAIPQVGLPVKTEVGVQRANGIASFEAVLDLPAPEGDPTADPVLQGVELKFSDENGESFAQNNNEPVLFLTADNALIDSEDLATSKGSRFEDLTPLFYVGNEVIEGTVLLDLSEEIDENRATVAVKVPNTVPLGSSRMSLTRSQDVLSEQSGTEPVYVPVEFESNEVRLKNEKEYVFTALASADSLSVVDATNPEAAVNDTSSEDLLLGRIPVGVDNVTDRPESLAITGDNSRIYVPLKFSGGVAVVDPIALSQVDNEPDTPDVAEPIPLPDGAPPVDIALGLRDELAYIADERNPNIYVLDIDPFSDSYHEVLQTIVLDTERGDEDLNRLAISSDGGRLFVTSKDGYIYAVNIDPLDEPEESEINSNKWHEQIGRFKTEQGAMGVSATNSAGMMTFTSGNRSFDFNGFGVLEVTNDDTLSFEAEIRYTELGLGLPTDYFDVNEGYGVTLTKDASYAFVAGYNWRGNINDNEVLDGGNVGIIEDPLGENPRMVAATRPIPGRLTRDLVLSNDDKYLYVSNPNLSGSGDVFVFDVEEMMKTLEEPEEYVIDGLDRGVGSPFFDESTSREVTQADFASVPIDDINPEISIAADYEILLEDRPRNQFTFGVPEDSTRSPINIGGNPREIAITGGDRLLELSEIDLTDNSTGEGGGTGEGNGGGQPDLTPTFEWNFGEGAEDIQEVNLFVSTFGEGEGLLPWEELVDLSDSSVLPGLSEGQKRELLTRDWNGYDDFNPDRILTATWKKDEGKWYWRDRETEIPAPTSGQANTNTSFTLPDELSLTAGQNYHWAVQAVTATGDKEVDVNQFRTKQPAVTTPFSSVTVFTHGFEVREQPQPPHYAKAFAVAASGAEELGAPGVVLRYNGKTGEWEGVDELGRLKPGVTASDAIGKPLVLMVDWAKHGESVIPDSGFTEGAADAVVADLAKLDKDLDGQLFSSPMHFMAHSRGTIVTSEMIQRLGTYFEDKVGKKSTSENDLHVTYIDAHDFKQKLPTGRFDTFYEPSVQVWDNVNFADNYFQEVPKPDDWLALATPIGRNIPYPAPAPADPPINPPEWSGEPDISIRLGALPGSEDANANPRQVGANPSATGDYSQNFAGLTKDVLLGDGPHGRINWWYDGTIDLSNLNRPGTQDEPGIYRRLSDGHYDLLFDRAFYDKYKVLNPWYQPDHTKANFEFADENAPKEGIGTGWFYSVLGGGKDLRPSTSTPRVGVDFDNTFAERMRGDGPVASVFNGNFDAVTKPTDRFAPYPPTVRGPRWRYEMPGWSFHNGKDGAVNSYESLYLENVDTTGDEANRNYALSMGKSKFPGAFGAPVRLAPLTEITHNRMYVPDWAETLTFDVQVNEGSDDDAIAAYMQQEGSWLKLGEFELREAMDEFETLLFDVPGSLRGETSQLRFVLLDKGGNGLDAELLLDDVFFTDEVETVALDLITGDGTSGEGVQAMSASSGNNIGLNNELFELTWQAPDKGKKIVEIRFDGFFERFLKIDYSGYQDIGRRADVYQFKLKAGGPDLTFKITPLEINKDTYFTQDGARVKFTDLDRDRLYGARFLTTEYAYNPDTRRTIKDTKSYFRYRWINVVDPEATMGRSVELPPGVDDTAVFHRTLADGQRGFVRDKKVDFVLPKGFETKFVKRNQSNSEFTYSDPQKVPGRRNRGFVTWQFDPVDANNQVKCYETKKPVLNDENVPVAIECKTDLVDIVADGNNVGVLEARGTATEPVEIKLDLDGFQKEFRRIIDTGEVIEIFDDESKEKQLFSTQKGQPISIKGELDAPRSKEFLEKGGLIQDSNPDRKLIYYVFPLEKAEDYPTKMPELRPVSSDFFKYFADFLPEKKKQAQTNNTLDTFYEDLSNYVENQSEMLLAAVQKDFEPLEGVYKVTGDKPTNANETKLSWVNVLNDGGVAIDGKSTLNFGDQWLKPILIDEKITKVSKEWAMAQSLYMPDYNGLLPDGSSVRVNIPTHFNWESSDEFARFVSTTVSHELGHTFGLIDAYHRNNIPIFPPGEDMMSAANPYVGDLDFDFRNVNLLQAAVGFHESPYPDMTQRPFFRTNNQDNALLMQMKNWKLPKETLGLNTSSYDPDYMK
ncbi:MAG: DUF4114 domain-containing protein [Cyanobacteriota bacterium]|nr:DUF4114 domain-containing protein [Cyanobacteriota bacterium]